MIWNLEATDHRCVLEFWGRLAGPTALALADRAVKFTLFDKNETLLSRAAAANDGKIHLGYMYAGDPILSTAKTMMAGALAFAPVLERYHTPAGTVIFGVGSCHLRSPPRQSTGAEDVHAYLQTVHALINEAADRREQAYFGKD